MYFLYTSDTCAQSNNAFSKALRALEAISAIEGIGNTERM